MEAAALIIFIVTYLGIIFTRLPGINVDRPSAAFFGAVAMILAGVLPFAEAVRAIDFNTIALLLGMMIVIAVLELDGFFSLVAQKTISFARNPFQLLVFVTFVTGIASAFLVNDAVVLLFTPVIITICRSARVNPAPYLIAEILSSNIGSAMTITGNPQNMLIGISSGIPYGKFLLHLLPVSVLGMIVTVAAVKFFYPDEFRRGIVMEYHGNSFDYNYSSMKYSVPIFALVTILFFFSHRIGVSIPMVALAGGALVLIFGKIKPSDIIRQVDWVLLLFFASLFIVVRGVEVSGILEPLMEFGPVAGNATGLGAVHISSLVLSQVVSNVPFVILMIPVLRGSGSGLLWLALASASTLAGNATIIGAMANLIVIESAKKSGVHIGFREFMKIGLAVTLITLTISMGVLFLQMVLGLAR
ncbi:MAG: anion transporter [Spirochaetes bacterium]|nr:anion transporter [Spirochaetota bacterium]